MPHQLPLVREVDGPALRLTEVEAESEELVFVTRVFDGVERQVVVAQPNPLDVVRGNGVATLEQVQPPGRDLERTIGVIRVGGAPQTCDLVRRRLERLDATPGESKRDADDGERDAQAPPWGEDGQLLPNPAASPALLAPTACMARRATSPELMTSTKASTASGSNCVPEHSTITSRLSSAFRPGR